MVGTACSSAWHACLGKKAFQAVHRNMMPSECLKGCGVAEDRPGTLAFCVSFFKNQDTVTSKPGCVMDIPVYTHTPATAGPGPILGQDFPISESQFLHL